MTTREYTTSYGTTGTADEDGQYGATLTFDVEFEDGVRTGIDTEETWEVNAEVTVEIYDGEICGISFDEENNLDDAEILELIADDVTAAYQRGAQMVADHAAYLKNRN